MPDTLVSPWTSTTWLCQTNSIFGLSWARCCITLEARSSPLRWMRKTLSANRVRNRASSTAESPPPTTAISWPRKKKPSQVAHVETP